MLAQNHPWMPNNGQAVFAMFRSIHVRHLYGQTSGIVQDTFVNLSLCLGHNISHIPSQLELRHIGQPQLATTLANIWSPCAIPKHADQNKQQHPGIYDTRRGHIWMVNFPCHFHNLHLSSKHFSLKHFQTNSKVEIHMFEPNNLIMYPQLFPWVPSR